MPDLNSTNQKLVRVSKMSQEAFGVERTATIKVLVGEMPLEAPTIKLVSNFLIPRKVQILMSRFLYGL